MAIKGISMGKGSMFGKVVEQSKGLVKLTVVLYCIVYLLLSKAHLDFLKDSNTNITC